MAVTITRPLMSGFVAYDDSRLKLLKAPALTMQQIAINDRARTQDLKNYYDEEIENLCQQYFNNPKIINTFEFREEILKTWKRVFDNTSITPWFMLQENMNQINYIHQRYLVELIAFVYCNQPRTMMNANYRRVLFAGVSEQARQEHAADQRKNVSFKSITEALEGFNTSVDSFLLTWGNKKEGFADMVEVLDVIFGLRSEYTVAEQ